MKRAKLTAILALTLVFVTLLCACGKKPSTSDTTQGNVNPPADNQSAGDTTAAGDSGSNAVVGTDADFTVEKVTDTTCEITACFLKDAGSITVPEKIQGMTVVGLGRYAFSELAAKEIILPDTVEYLSRSAFIRCEKLEQVELGKGLKEVAGMAFEYCNSLLSVTFPEGLKTIGDCPFTYCANLGEVYFPASADDLGQILGYQKLTPNMIAVTPAGSAVEALAKSGEIPVKNP